MPWVLVNGEKKWKPEPKVEPHINASIWPTRDGQWAIGTLMICERLEGTDTPNNVIVKWKDGLGVEYCLRPQIPRLPVPEYDPANKPAIPRHFFSALFEIGSDVLIKVKHAPAGWQRTEGAAMRLVQERAPSIPIAEPIHYWVDEEWARYFVIQRRVQGDTLDHAWFQLESRERWKITQEIAKYIKLLSEIVVPRFQAADGTVLGDDRLLAGNLRAEVEDPYPENWPGPFTPEEFHEYLRKVSDGVEPPEIGPDFHFYHCDLSPGNVILTSLEKVEGKEREVRVAAIIDWEDAGFYPKFWIPFWIANPLPTFAVSLTEAQHREQGNLCWQYRNMLLDSLVQFGFQDGEDFLPWWSEFKEKGRKFEARQCAEKYAEQKSLGAKQPDSI